MDRKRRVDGRQLRKIYAIGNALGIVERRASGDIACHGDSLHELVSMISGKESLRDLDAEEADRVIAALERRQGHYTPPKEKRKKWEKVYPDGITPGQSAKIWALMYALRSFDRDEESCSLGKRLAAIVRKDLQRECPEGDPLVWIDGETASQLIEILKHYVKNAEEKARERNGAF